MDNLSDGDPPVKTPQVDHPEVIAPIVRPPTINDTLCQALLSMYSWITRHLFEENQKKKLDNRK